jgi:hypothetical protein
MALGDQLRNLGKKAKDLAKGHPDQADQAIDKVGDQVRQRTGGKYDSQIDSAEDKAGEFLGIDDQNPQGPEKTQHGGGQQ